MSEEVLKALPLLKIDASRLKPVAPMTAELAFIATSQLVIDTRYQRDVMNAGKNQITRIAQNFDWNKFSALIVAPIEDGRFAIIDGQHRATAAKARGLTPLPAYVVHIDAVAQASAFAAVNGAVTPISSMHVFKAALAAGEGWAGELNRIAQSCGITILTYPIQRRFIPRGATMAVGALRNMLRLHGQGCLETALRAVTETRHNLPGMLNQTTIRALVPAAALAATDLKIGPATFPPAIGVLDLPDLVRESIAGASEAGISRYAWLTEAVLDALRSSRRAVA